VTRLKNPVLPGFHPDPSICRVGGDFYLAASSFAYFPGVPIFHSRDLAHWRQIGSALDRPSQLPLEGAEVSRGIFAPTIRWHGGVFYIATTNVSAGGNFLVTASDPAGPWSEPIWIEGADGIDPSLFFDDDGRCYYHGTCERREGARYYGDNEIYLQELDLASGRLIGERHAIWHSALRGAVWPEGPHVYKIGEWHYLLISEGGTAHEHAITVARSKSLTGYYEGFKGNPILTHRHLGRDFPISNVGHGDLVQTPRGEWWMALLASRPYGGRHRNLGRETFMAPVSWEDGWPVVSPGIGQARLDERFPDLEPAPIAPPSLGESDAFDFRELSAFPAGMMFLRNPVPGDYELAGGPEGGLFMRLGNESLAGLGPVSYCCVRQRHMSFEAQALLRFRPESEGEGAGLAIFQSHKCHYLFLLALKGGAPALRVAKCSAGEQSVPAERACESLLGAAFAGAVPAGGLFLRISARGQELSFSCSLDGERWAAVLEGADARILSPDFAGGFVGATIGMHAFSGGAGASGRRALFPEFSYRAI